MSKPRPTNEVPPDPSKTAARSAEATQAPTQATTQTASSDPLADWRSSLSEAKRLATELGRLQDCGAAIQAELTDLAADINTRADAIIDQPAVGDAEPEKVALLALASRELAVGKEQQACNRALDKVITKLQNVLCNHADAWSRLARAVHDHVQQTIVTQLLAGVETRTPEMEAGAVELAKGSATVRDTAKYSNVGAVSFAWSRSVSETTRQPIVETITMAAAEHIRLAQPLLDAAASLPSPPLFELPPAPPPETHPEWNEALNADVALVDRLIAASGRTRETISDAELEILTRSASGNDSYKRDKEELLKYVVGVGEPTR